MTRLLRGGDTVDLNNYGPMSKLPRLSKLLEPSLYKKYVDIILSSHRSGVRAGYGAATAASVIVDDTAAALDDEKRCVFVC